MKTKEEWLDTMELRLRRAYLDVADMDEAEAMHFLEQEMRSHLDDVQGEALRRDYMLSLRERFPLMLSEKGLLSAGDLATAIPSTPKEQLDNALEVLKQQWPALDEAERQAFLESIDTSATARGPAGERQSETLSSPSDEMARFLKLAETSVISDERLQEVFLILLKTLCQIDALGTQFYKQLGLNREISQEDIRKLLGGYVSGDAVSMDAINKALNETRLKVGLTISAIASLSSAFAQSHLARFQPMMIEQIAGKGGLLGGKEAKCWKQYVTMSSDLHPNAVEKAINEILSKQLRKLKQS